jgi:hypothetical protein
MSIKPIFIILVDISGYTKFINMHRIELLHAERIIAELMESVLEKVDAPVVVHEILGDAISLYAFDDGSPDLGDKIYRQVEVYVETFRKREAFLLRECNICTCKACLNVDALRLKAILHHGEAAFTKVRDIQKISGQDTITAHRLLKNSINSDEYIFVTESFAGKCQTLDVGSFEKHKEQYNDVGPVKGFVQNYAPVEKTGEKVSFWQRLKFWLKLDAYMVARLFGKKQVTYRNLPR